MLEYADLIDEIIEEETFDDVQTQILTRVGLANYFAAALDPAVRRVPDDGRADALRHRAADRALRRWAGRPSATGSRRCSGPKARGVPFSFVRVDRAGNMSKRQSATGFPFSRSGGTCPLWNVYEAFNAPGRVITQIAAMPDGQRYLWIARTVTHQHGGYGQPGQGVRRSGSAARSGTPGGWSTPPAWTSTPPTRATPIGAGLQDLRAADLPAARAAPIGRRLDLDENRSTFVPYPLRDGGPAVAAAEQRSSRRGARHVGYAARDRSLCPPRPVLRAQGPELIG